MTVAMPIQSAGALRMEELPAHTILKQTALWGVAMFIAIGGHLGLLVWALWLPPVEVADNAPPPAIMIELAAQSEAINTDRNEITQDEASTEVSVAQAAQKPEPPENEPVPDVSEQAAEEAVPASSVIEPPPPDVVEPVPQDDPVEAQSKTTLDNVQVPLPVMQARPVETKKAVEQQKPRKVEQRRASQPHRSSAASQAKTAAAAQVQQSDRNAANQPAAAMGFGSITPAKWQARLMAHLERRKRYPPGARARDEQGVAYVRFKIDAAGNVLSASLARSSGYADLDDEVVELVKRASPVPPPPPDVNRTITAPIRFDIR